jgi:predicted ester cyclase
MSTNSNRAIAERFVRSAFEAFDAVAVRELVTPDFQSDAWSAFGVPDGPEGVAQAVAMLGASFRNAGVQVEDVAADGDKVVMRYLWAADHEGELLGISATGRRVRMGGILIARLRHGRVAEYWRHEDLPDLMEQIGGLAAAV